MAASGVDAHAVSGRVHRVLVAELRAGEVEVIGPEAHHLVNVLRVRPGASVEAFDGAGSVAAGSVARVDRHTLTLRLEEPQVAATEAPLRVTVAVALLKSDKLTDVVRQCTELGAADFQLVVSQHADVSAMSPSRLQRLRRVAEEAARQSGRATVPAVKDPVALNEFSWEGPALVAHPYTRSSLADVWPGAAGAVAAATAATAVTAVTAATAAPASAALQALSPAGMHPADAASAITVITGPEGGFSEAEVSQLEQRGALGVRFGPRILRAETAPVALVSALLLPKGL